MGSHVLGRVMRAALPRLALGAARPAAASLTPLTHGLPTTTPCSGRPAAALGVVRGKHTFVVDPQGTCVDEDDKQEEKAPPQRMPADAEPHLLVCAFGHDRAGTLSPVTAAIRKHSGSIMQALERELSELEKTAVSKWKQKGEDAALGRLEPASGLAHVTCARYLRSEKSTEPAKKEDHRHHLALQGAQQVGLIHQVLEFLEQKQCKVQDLVTDTTRQSPTEPMLFHLECTVVTPADVCADVLQAELYQMADSLEMRLVFDRWMGYRYKHGSEVTECV